MLKLFVFNQRLSERESLVRLDFSWKIVFE